MPAVKSAALPIAVLAPAILCATGCMRQTVATTQCIPCWPRPSIQCSEATICAPLTVYPTDTQVVDAPTYYGTVTSEQFGQLRSEVSGLKTRVEKIEKVVPVN